MGLYSRPYGVVQIVLISLKAALSAGVPGIHHLQQYSISSAQPG